jgi:hypothetical protein
MSVLFTESFIAYPRWTGGVANAASDLTARTNYMANNSVFGLRHYTQSGTSPGVIPAVVADPLVTDRNVVYPNAHSGVSGAGACAIEMPLNLDGSHAFVMGFSVYITAAVMANSPTFTAIEVNIGVNSATKVLVITREGKFLDAALAAQSSKKLAADTQGYVEIRYFRNEWRVYFDDVLVLQKTGVVVLDFVEIRMLYNLAGNMVNVFYIGNWYALIEDSISPNVRLGPTTRVIGRRPASDVQAQWIRSSGASNAAVAAQDPNTNPTSLLQTDTVGSADFYTPVADATTQGASLIHAVVTRALVGNVDPVGHAFDCGVRVGTDVDYGNNFASSGFQSQSQPWAANKQVWTILGRTNGRTIVGGMGPMMYVLKHGGAGPLGWATAVFEGASGTVYFAAIVENSVGRLFALQSDGVLYTCAPGADETVAANWTLKTSPGGATWRDMIVGPSDYLVAVRTTTGFAFRSIDDGANWVAGNQPTTRTNCGICYANGQYVMVMNNATAANTYTSSDGLNWTARVLLASTWPSGNGNLMAVAFGNGVYVAVGAVTSTTGDLAIYTSPDAITWTKTTTQLKFYSSITAVGMFRVIFTDGRFIVTGDSSLSIWSTDGIAWERFTIPGISGSVQINALNVVPDGYALGVNNGLFRRYTPNNEKMLVEALSNKVLVRSVALNPQTDIAWTGPEAAAAEFGMKLTT